MISFVIIGKNISMTILKSIESVIKTISYNQIKKHEIIYIDSNSNDDSVKKALSYNNIKIYKITRFPNAAIARNLGFNQSKGDVIFFIDGDMEIIPKTLKKIYNEKDGLFFPFVSGDYIDYYYSEGKIINKKKYYNLNSNEYQVTTGGLFLIKRELWLKVGGMRTIFRRSQDLDLGLRMSNIGFPLLRIKDVLSIHHTIDYNNDKRYLEDLLKGNFLYQGLLYKYNIFNIHIYSRYIIKEITFFILIFVIIYNFLSFNPLLFLIYFCALIFKLIYKGKKLKESIKFFSRFIIQDFNLLVSLLFFWPLSKSEIYFKKIK
jgi:glycosyltransferase involved in cell wall biosynthesis